MSKCCCAGMKTSSRCNRSTVDRPPYPYVDEEQRKVARDAYVSWLGSRYSVPWIQTQRRRGRSREQANVDRHRTFLKA